MAKKRHKFLGILWINFLYTKNNLHKSLWKLLSVQCLMIVYNALTHRLVIKSNDKNIHIYIIRRSFSYLIYTFYITIKLVLHVTSR